MADTVAMRRAFERNARIVTTRPAVAQKTYVTRVHIRDGLTCDIEEGPWTLTADLSTIAGGNADIGKRKPLFTRAHPPASPLLSPMSPWSSPQPPLPASGW